MDNNLEVSNTVAKLSATGAGIGIAVAVATSAPVLASALIGTAIVTGIAGILAAKNNK